MTECQTPECEDRLPDLVAGTLSDSDQQQLRAHIAACPACAASLAVLRQVRALRPSAMPSGVSVDVSRVVAALPRPNATSEPSARPVLTVHRGAVAPAREPAASAPSMWQGRSLWRLAATVGVVLAGGLSVVVARRGASTFDAAPSALQVTESSGAVAPPVVERPIGAAPTAESLAAATSTQTPAPREAAVAANVAVSFGELDDVTDEELRMLLDRLEQWDGATSAEPTPTLPVVTSRSGSQP